MSEDRKGRKLSDAEIEILDKLVQIGLINYSKHDNCYFHYDRYQEKLTVIDFLLHPVEKSEDENEH